MQKNSTSKIVHRSLLVVTFMVLVHVFARLAWHFQLFVLSNKPRWVETGDYATITTTDVTNDGSLGDEITRTVPHVEKAYGTFWDYTPDMPDLLMSHFVGVAVTAILFLVIAWVVFDFTSE